MTSQRQLEKYLTNKESTGRMRCMLACMLCVRRVCMYACMYTCVHICMLVCMCVRTYVCMHIIPAVLNLFCTHVIGYWIVQTLCTQRHSASTQTNCYQYKYNTYMHTYKHACIRRLTCFSNSSHTAVCPTAASGGRLHNNTTEQRSSSMKSNSIALLQFKSSAA